MTGRFLGSNLTVVYVGIGYFHFDGLYDNQMKVLRELTFVLEMSYFSYSMIFFKMFEVVEDIRVHISEETHYWY